MSPTLLKLAAELLDMAAETFSNHGCNDFKMTGRFTEAERAEIAALLNHANYGDRGPRDPDDLTTPERLKDWAQDWLLMQATAHGLRLLADHIEQPTRFVDNRFKG